MESVFYKEIKQHYIEGLYNEDNLNTFILAGMLTEGEKDEIINSKTKIN